MFRVTPDWSCLTPGRVLTRGGTLTQTWEGPHPDHTVLPESFQASSLLPHRCSETVPG